MPKINSGNITAAAQNKSQLPISMRTAGSEAKYQLDMKLGKLRPLRSEKIIKEYHSWVLIDNRYPYDMVFQKHHLLLPKRDIADRGDMTGDELTDLYRILETDGEKNYDGYLDNFKRRRSITTLYHVHLFRYHSSRSEIKL